MILVPQPGIEPEHLPVDAQSLNPHTAGEVPPQLYLNKESVIFQTIWCKLAYHWSQEVRLLTPKESDTTSVRDSLHLLVNAVKGSNLGEIYKFQQK